MKTKNLKRSTQLTPVHDLKVGNWVAEGNRVITVKKLIETKTMVVMLGTTTSHFLGFPFRTKEIARTYPSKAKVALLPTKMLPAESLTEGHVLVWENGMSHVIESISKVGSHLCIHANREIFEFKSKEQVRIQL